MKKFFTRHLLLILIGTIIWSLTMVKSGLIYDYGMGFWGPNGHDGIWHIAIINSLSNGSLSMPIFAGEYLKNYHIGFDILLAIFHRVTQIPVINLYFQIFPPIAAFLIGVLTYKFVKLWSGSKTQAFWATYFVYFSGSFGWIVTFLRNREINGESLFWAQQSLSTLVNPPFALSLVFMLLGLYFLTKYVQKPKLKTGILVVLTFSLLVQIKIYSGILILSGLFVCSVIFWILRRDNKYFILFTATFIMSTLLILPTYKFGTKTLIFEPFWFLESMVATSDRLYWPKMAEAIGNYKLSGNLLKLTLSYALTFAIFLAGNFGIRILALPWFANSIRRLRDVRQIDIVIVSIIFFGTIIPTLFIQSGNSWNSIQFFYYSLFFLSIVSGITAGKYFERESSEQKVWWKHILNFRLLMPALVIFTITIPTVYATLRHYLPLRPPSMISEDELVALDFLKELGGGVVLTIPFDKDVARNYAGIPKPLYVYESTAYVSAISGKRTYMEDEVNLEITGFDWKKRREDILKNFDDPTYIRNLGISYVYVSSSEYFSYGNTYNVYKIYDNGNTVIYRLH